jgi:hypothetical protein
MSYAARMPSSEGVRPAKSHAMRKALEVSCRAAAQVNESLQPTPVNISSSAARFTSLAGVADFVVTPPCVHAESAELFIAAEASGASVPDAGRRQDRAACIDP